MLRNLLNALFPLERVRLSKLYHDGVLSSQGVEYGLHSNQVKMGPLQRAWARQTRPLDGRVVA